CLKARRPIRPKPLIATFTAIITIPPTCEFLFCCQGAWLDCSIDLNLIAILTNLSRKFKSKFKPIFKFCKKVDFSSLFRYDSVQKKQSGRRTAMSIVCDFHLHSGFSEDSSSPMEEMVRAAAEKGLKILCFTEHYDLD